MRTRVYGRTRDARNIVSAARGRAFSGQARAATSSFISPDHLDWYSDVALELWAMTAPTEGVLRKVTEMEPVAAFIRHLVWGPLVFHAGMTNDQLPTLKEQCAEILPRAGARLKENGCDWHNVVRISFMLHTSEKPQSVLDIASTIVPAPLENAEIELVEGYSTPGKLVEIEVTARRRMAARMLRCWRLTRGAAAAAAFRAVHDRANAAQNASMPAMVASMGQKDSLRRRCDGGTSAATAAGLSATAFDTS